MSDVPAQLNVKIDAKTKADFAAACERRHESQAAAIERMCQGYVLQQQNAGIMHLDGSMCPISEMILSLGRAVENQLATQGLTMPLDAGVMSRA
jgi:hypothetical protein